jgi:hypothetical protein
MGTLEELTAYECVGGLFAVVPKLGVVHQYCAQFAFALRRTMLFVSTLDYFN